MLYKFKSKAAGDLIMLEPNGKQVLEIIGKDASPKGIILPAEMPAAVNALEAAVSEEGSGQGNGDNVSLRQRVVPFLDMLRRCSQAGEEIVWGV